MWKSVYEVFAKCQTVLIALGILIHHPSDKTQWHRHISSSLSYKESEAVKVIEFARNYSFYVAELEFEFNQMNPKSYS